MEKRQVPYILILILSASLAFGLGRLSKIEEGKPALIIESQESEDIQIATSSKFVASKTGTKYYYPSCSGASRIKETNKVWFNTKEQAKRAGYSPATNCEGL
ncbi:MAG: hypothetical protein A2749_00045 [Parcubacteria group bacterium RIFCSPHIGHO2_01_FULL_45_26]|nr:MAG: hypothetical protein A2749_00045 [Parcubacteria group bacterium RIFCSPHIGHO2_01_FULL_45_26]